MKRAYSVLEVKSIDADSRHIRGLATTPSTDRQGDVVLPEGAVFQLPIPLLWQHDHAQPIGHVISASVTTAGIEIVAKISTITDVGRLKDRVDEAWHAIKNGLVKGLSIGFRALERRPFGDGWKFTSWEWLELSAVTIPANADATITTIKRADRAARPCRVVRLGPEFMPKASPTSGWPDFLDRHVDAMLKTVPAKASAKVHSDLEMVATMAGATNATRHWLERQVRSERARIDDLTTRLDRLERDAE